ncbi:RseA family anti-sigma factor [Telluria beijingensis]|uniref:RseA family anti-sigma factor n=1 Tax=Telluria beijingensis TaxID=3068633 RepID=UPI002795E75F|nr:RseA family anti-sigma factor [Massilia sp. REN29]
MDTTKKLRELISALQDGALPDADLELALAALQGSDGRQAWDLYHLIGDALRDASASASAPALSPDFRARLAERLASEPPPLRRAAVAVEPTGLAAVLAKTASSS